MILRRHRPTAALVCLALALLTAGGCGGGDGGEGGEPAGRTTTAPETGGGQAGRPGTVVIRDFEFMPPEITVRAGTQLRFENRDTVAHTASVQAGGGFDTGGIDRGDTATVTVERPGRLPYVCEFHPFMKGTVVVE